MPPKLSLKFQLYKAVQVDKDKFTTKLIEAPAIKQKEYGMFQPIEKYAIVQADTIYMREDTSTGHKYILTVLDVATRAMDCEAMKGRTAYDVIEAFDSIFKRKHITDDIEFLYTDQGSEFMNADFKEFLSDRGIVLRHTMAHRKQQTQPIEGLNNTITKALGAKMTTEELETNKEFNNWSQLLPNIVKVLNDEDNLKTPNLKNILGEPKATAKELDNLLKVGDVVHVRLQAPKDHLPDEKGNYKGLWGYKFRNGDLRYELETTRIKKIIIVPNQPIRYMVEKYNNVSFLRKELLVTDEKRKDEHNKNNPQKVETEPVLIDLQTHKGPLTRSMAKRLKE